MFDETVIGIDIGSYSVKFAELRAGLRGVEFQRFEELVLPQDASAEEVEATIQLFTQQRGLILDYVVTALDTRFVTQRHLRFPFNGAKRIAPAVAYEIEEELPLPIESVITAHDIVRLREDQTDVLVVVAARLEIERYLDSMHRMELEPAHIEAEGAVLANLSRYFQLGDLSHVLLDVGHRKTNLCLVVDGHPVALRRIPIGGHHLTQALSRDAGWSYEEATRRKHELGVFEGGSTKPISPSVRDVLERMGREVQRTIQATVPDPVDSLAPVDILLVGGSAQLPNLREFLTEQTGLACQPLRLPSHIAGSAAFEDIDLATHAQAASLALRASRTERITNVDFRQAEFSATPDFAGMRGQLRLTLALFGLFLGLWVAGAGLRAFVEDFNVSSRERALESLYTQLFPGSESTGDPLKQIESRARDTRELAAHLGVLGTGSSVLEVLREIARHKAESLPLTLDDLLISARAITARGLSRDIATIENFKSELQKVPSLEAVQITNVSTDQGRGGQKRFTLTMRVGGRP